MQIKIDTVHRFICYRKNMPYTYKLYNHASYKSLAAYLFIFFKAANDSTVAYMYDLISPILQFLTFI